MNITNLQIILLFILMAITEILAIFLLKKGSTHKNLINMYLGFGLILIIFTYILFYITMKSDKHISVIHAIHHTTIATSIFIMSFLYFNQELNKKQLFALLAVIISTFMLSIYDDNHSH